jgi:hypothetical protein
MNPRETQEVLIESMLTAYRERGRHGLPMAPPAWADLSPEARLEAYRRQLAAREVERALDERGWSSTVRAVMEEVGG